MSTHNSPDQEDQEGLAGDPTQEERGTIWTEAQEIALEALLEPPMLGERKVCRVCKVEKDSFHDFLGPSQRKSLCKKCNYDLNRSRVAKNYPKSLLKSARERAVAKNIPFTLTIDDIQIPRFCPVLGIPLVINPTRLKNDSSTRSQMINTPTIDRIDNSKGYTPENICVISHRANIIKNDASIEEVRRVLAYMEAHFRNNTTP